MSDEARGQGRSAGTDDAASTPPASSEFALAAAGLGQWSWDAAADVVVWSPQEERLHGLAPGAFGGDYAAFLDLVHPDDRARVRQAVGGSLAERADHHVEYRARWPDGTIRWIAGWGRVVRDAAGTATGMAGVAMDITDRKTAEQRMALLARTGEVLAPGLDFHARLDAVARLIVPDLADWCAVDLLEDDGLLHRLTVVHRDPACAALAADLRERYPVLAVDSDQVISQVARTGESWLNAAVDPARLRPEARDERHSQLLVGLGLRAEMIVPMLVEGRAVGALTMALSAPGRDYDAATLAVAEEVARRCALALDHARLDERAARELAARREAEAALRLSEERLRIGLERSPITLYQQDRELRYTWLHTPQGYLGTADAIGKTDFELVPANEAIQLTALKRRVLETGQSTQADVTAFAPSAGMRTYDLTIEPLRDAAGAIVGIAGVAIDISERRTQDERIRRLQALSADLASAATTDQVVAAVEAHARAATGATAVSAAVLDERGDRLRLLTPRAPGGKRVARRSAPMAADRPLAEAALRSAVVARASDEAADNAILAVPLVADGATLGALELQFAQPRAVGDAEQAFVQTLANLCAQALARARTFDREREARTKAEALEMRFRATFEQAAVGMGHALPSGRWLRVNPRLCQMLGYEREELLRLTFFDVTDPEDRAANAESHARLLRGEVETAVIEKRMRRKDGAAVWVAVTSSVVRDAAGRPAYTIAALEDISRRKVDAAERERLLTQVDAERARLETVLQQLPVGVVIADAGSGEIVMANRQVDAIFGAPVETERGFVIFDDDGQPRSPDDNVLARTIRSGEPVAAEELRVRRGDGSVGVVRASAAPVRDRDDRIVAGVMTMEDLTSHRRDEAGQRLLAAVGELLAARVDDATALEDLARLTLPEFADACLIDIDGRDGGERALVAAAVDPERVAAWRSGEWSGVAAIGAGSPFAALLRAGLPALLADASGEPALASFGASSPASILAVPLTIRGAASGALTFLMTESGRRFDEADVRLAQELARRVAVAIDNGRLYADEQRARRQAERTTDRLARSQALTTALSEAVTVDEVAAVVVDQGLATAGAASAALALLNGDGAALEIVAAAGDPAIALAPAGPRIPLDRPGLYADAIRSARPVFLGSARDLRERRPALADAIDPAAAGAVAIVPLVAERRALGAIGLTFAEAQPFADDQTALLHAYARQSTQAIERARLYAAEQAARADAEATRSRLAFLADASAALAASLDIDATLQRLGELLVPALADWCAIHIVRDDGAVEQLVVAHADPAKVAWARALQERYPYDPNTPTGVPQVLRAGASELYPEITDELLAASTEDPEQLALARSLGFASAMIVPLIAHGAIFGAITLVTAESGRHYDDDDLRFAEDVARRAAIAVSNARHYQAEERARHEAERANIRKTQLQTITAALAGALTLDDVARAVVDASVGALGAVAGSVSLQTEGDDVYRVVYAQGYDGERVEPWRTFTPETPIPLAAAIRDRTPILLGSAAEVAARYPNLNIMAGQPSSHSVAAIPLVFEDRALGALGLSFAEEQSFTADDLAFLVALARQSAVALERARLYDAERLTRDKAQAAEHLARRGAERITAFANVSRAIAEAGFDVQAALDAVAQIIAAAMDDYVVIQLLSDDGGWIDVRAIADGDPHHQHPDRQQARSSRQDAHHGFSAHVIETGAPLIVNDVPRERDETLAPPVSWERLAAAQIRSLLVVPLRARERRIGTMTLMRTRAGEPYTASDVGFTQELADRAALAIDNARLYGAARDAVRARDEFLSIAAHELRTPVTTVKGYAQLLRRAEERDGLTSRRARQFIRAIESSSDRLRLLADDLLDVSRLRLGRMPLRPARVALGEVAAATIERLREQLGAADRIVVEQAPDVPDVDADPDRIDQILSNLLDNAAKYSPPASPVTVRIEPSDGGVLISVRDEGIGLPVDELEPIFEPFQRASNAERENLPGLGLGLAICRGIAEQHGGRIWAESAGEGTGTTMRLWLPTDGAGEPDRD